MRDHPSLMRCFCSKTRNLCHVTCHHRFLHPHHHCSSGLWCHLLEPVSLGSRLLDTPRIALVLNPQCQLKQILVWFVDLPRKQGPLWTLRRFLNSLLLSWQDWCHLSSVSSFSFESLVEGPAPHLDVK